VKTASPPPSGAVTISQKYALSFGIYKSYNVSFFIIALLEIYWKVFVHNKGCLITNHITTFIFRLGKNKFD